MQSKKAIRSQQSRVHSNLEILQRCNDELGLLGGYARYLAPDSKAAERLVSETIHRARLHPRQLSRPELLATMRQVLRQGR